MLNYFMSQIIFFVYIGVTGTQKGRGRQMIAIRRICRTLKQNDNLEICKIRKLNDQQRKSLEHLSRRKMQNSHCLP